MTGRSLAGGEVAGAVARPAPTPDQDSAFYWEGLRQHRLLLQGCTGCGRRRFPPMPACPYCAHPQADIVEGSGRGRVYSWVVVHRAFNPAFAGEVPYTIAVVDLEEGPRVAARLEGVRENVRPDRAVTAVYVDHDGWTELRFEVGP